MIDFLNFLTSLSKTLEPKIQPFFPLMLMLNIVAMGLAMLSAVAKIALQVIHWFMVFALVAVLTGCKEFQNDHTNQPRPVIACQTALPRLQSRIEPAYIGWGPAVTNSQICAGLPTSTDSRQ